MKFRILLVLLLIIGMATTILAQTSGDYRVRSTVVSGNWNTQIWQKYTTAWANVTTSPTSADGVITILSGKTISVSVNVTVDQVVVQSGGTLKVNAARTMSVANGAGTDLTVAGTLNVEGIVNATGSVSITGTNVFNGVGIISGTGSYTLANGATLNTKNPLGFDISGSNGCIRTTTRLFSSGANYIFSDAATASVTGTGLPSTVHNLNIENPYGVTLSVPVTVTNQLIFANSGTVYLDIYNLTMGPIASVVGFSSIEYSATGLLVNLNTVDYLEVYIPNPVSFPTNIGELLIQDDVTVPNDFTVTTLNFNGSHMALNNKTMTLAGLDIAFRGLSQIHDLIVSLSNTANSYGSGVSIARTWTTSADFIGGALEVQFTYPESETNAFNVNVWNRNSDSVGPWNFVGTFTTFGTDPRTVSVFGINNLGNSTTSKDWTISNFDQTLPVELTSFTAIPTNTGYVVMQWVTQSETGAAGFHIYRNDNDNLATSTVVSPLIEATNTSQETSYTFMDSELPGNGTYYFWLQNQEINGETTFHGPIRVNVTTGEDENEVPDIPLVTKLFAPYPNPFNPVISIPYYMAKSEHVQIMIFNTKGQKICTLQNNSQNSGYYRATWYGKSDKGEEVASGLYYVKMITDSYTATQKVMMMK